MNIYREHPLRILKHSFKYLWLLIFPLIRGIKTVITDYEPEKVHQFFEEWLNGAWFDIAILVIMLIFGLLQWYCSRFSFSDRDVVHKQGILLRRKTVIPYSSFAGVTRESPFYLRPFGAVRLHVDTCSGRGSSANLHFLTNRRLCGKFLREIPHVETDEKTVYKHIPSLRIILFFSILFSSSFSGVAYIALFLYQGGKIAREIMTSGVTQLTEFTAAFQGNFSYTQIPAAAIILGIFLLVSWLLSLLFNIVRYSNFSVTSTKHIIEVNSGVLTKKRFYISTDKINYVDLRQNLIMKIFNVMSVNVSCFGYGKDRKKNMPVLMPIQRKTSVERNLERVVKMNFSKESRFKPAVTSFFAYIGNAVYLSLGMGVIVFYFGVLERLTSFAVFDELREITRGIPHSWTELAVFVGIMAQIPTIWYVIIRLGALLTSGVNVEDDSIQISYARGFKFHTVIGKCEDLAKVVIRQSPTDIIWKKCRMTFYFRDRITTGHPVEALSIQNAQAILNQLNSKKK